MMRLTRLRNSGYLGADVVHFVNNYVPRKSPTVAYVATVHDVDPIALPSVHSRRYALYFRKVIRATLARADIIEVHTQTVRDELLNHYPLDPERIRIGGDGLSSEFTGIADATEKSGPEVPTLLYVGAINSKKNSPWLVQTVIHGVRSGALPKLRLILAGRNGPGFQEVREGLRESPDIVEWRVTPSLEDLIRLYCSCSCVVLPSLREGFGRPLLEGMYCGKAVIASRIPSSVEVAGKAAFFFDLENREEFYKAVHAAIAGEDAAVRHATATTQLGRYSWERLAGVYASIYRAAVHHCREVRGN